MALITCYLVDGDASGREMRKQLLQNDVPATHVMQLPAGKAIEDLVDRKLYLDTVDGFPDADSVKSNAWPAIRPSQRRW